MKLSLIGISTLATLFLNSSVIAQPSTCDGVPALTVIAKNGNRSTLIGSYHVAAAGLRQPADSVLDGVKNYVVEQAHSTESKRPESLSKQPRSDIHSMLGPRPDWSKSLSEEQYALFRERVSCNMADSGYEIDVDFTTDALLFLRSAATAAAVAIRHCGPAGMSSRDDILRAAAQRHGLDPRPLETQEAVEKQRRKVDELTYQHIFANALTPASQRAQALTIQALNSGIYDEILSILRDLYASPDEADKFITPMVTERNLAWMPNLENYLNEGDAFVNVGASHLPGPNGLIQLLREKDYIVNATCLPADKKN